MAMVAFIEPPQDEVVEKILRGHQSAAIAPLLEGKGKAMVVVGSRVEAVRWCCPGASHVLEECERFWYKIHEMNTWMRNWPYTSAHGPGSWGLQSLPAFPKEGTLQ